MDVNWINPFITSIRHTFSGMVGTILTTGSPYVRDADDRVHRVYPISATIDLRGPVTGLVVISLAEVVCLRTAAKLLGKDVETVDADCRDALGELANMVVGGAKAKIATDRPINVGLPKIIQTEQAVYPKGLPILVIPFEAAMGRLIIQVSMEKQAKPAKGAAPATPAKAEEAAATATPEKAADAAAPAEPAKEPEPATAPAAASAKAA